MIVSEANLEVSKTHRVKHYLERLKVGKLYKQNIYQGPLTLRKNKLQIKFNLVLNGLVIIREALQSPSHVGKDQAKVHTGK